MKSGKLLPWHSGGTEGNDDDHLDYCGRKRTRMKIQSLNFLLGLRMFETLPAYRMEVWRFTVACGASPTSLNETCASSLKPTKENRYWITSIEV